MYKLAFRSAKGTERIAHLSTTKFNMIQRSYINENLESNELNENFSDFYKKTEETLLDPAQKEFAAAIKKIATSAMKRGVHEKRYFLNPKPPIINVSNIKYASSKLFLEQPLRPLSGSEGDIALNSKEQLDLCRRFLYQQCLIAEQPGRYELQPGVNEDVFLNPPSEWENRLLKSWPVHAKTQRFIMQKWSLKNNHKRKQNKKALLRENNSPTEKGTDQEFFPCLLPKISSTYARDWETKRAVLQNQYFQPLVFDMRFHEEISSSSSSLINQMNTLYCRNISSPHPFNLFFCNSPTKSRFFESTKTKLSHHFSDVCTVTEKSYLNMEPVINYDNLVYLSPDASQVMTEFRHDKVYVIGGLVDKKLESQMTRTISNSERINSQKLPLSLYLKWGGIGHKQELAVNIVFDILMTLKQTGNWIKALQHIPSRLHRGLTDMGQELVGFDEKIIYKFDHGQRWLEKKGTKINPTSGTQQDRPKQYFGKY